MLVIIHEGNCPEEQYLCEGLHTPPPYLPLAACLRILAFNLHIWPDFTLEELLFLALFVLLLASKPVSGHFSPAKGPTTPAVSTSLTPHASHHANKAKLIGSVSSLIRGISQGVTAKLQIGGWKVGLQPRAQLKETDKKGMTEGRFISIG